MKKTIVSFTLNGEPVDVLVNDNTTLLDLLRDQIGLTGTKKGCEEGECGACTVIVDDRPINSCVTLACDVNGCYVITIEGLAKDGVLTPIQQQFREPHRANKSNEHVREWTRKNNDTSAKMLDWFLGIIRYYLDKESVISLEYKG